MNQDHFNLLTSGVEAFNEFRRNNPETFINLGGANLRSANLSGANLRSADLRSANLRSANLDMSCLPLWCGSLKMKTDEKQRIQIAFHFASLIAHCENATDEEKKIYEDINSYVNRFHRTDVDRLPAKL